MWERGLKLNSEVEKLKNELSLPMWERGLKLLYEYRVHEI